jgi:hypothetical protein
MRVLVFVASITVLAGRATAQVVPLQPLAQNIRRLETALVYLGQPFRPADQKTINEAIGNPDEATAVKRLQEVLDPYTLVKVEINPESRVKVEQGTANPDLVEGGTRLFLVKVTNQAGVRAPLVLKSPNAGKVYITSTGAPEPKMQLTPADARDRWADISLYNKPPMPARLTGLGLEYVILEIYSRDAGQRSAVLQFDIGGNAGQDVGFRSELPVVFNAVPARPITFHVRDENGKPAMASMVIRDRLNRLYPNPSKRLAPDFPFQPQIYRFDGESVRLPAGYYTVAYSGGPEYALRTKEFGVDDQSPAELSLQLERWIDPARLGWYSGDHHTHAAGCSHYQNPTEGVLPADMIRQILGESLNVGSILTWGPCYYYQKQFFTGKDDPLSKADRLMHYDLEVSGFPSSHAGHTIFLGLKEQDYPGAERIEQWPSWDLPVLQWGKKQGAVAGFAHSGWGLEIQSRELPSYEMPAFDGIGANEYIVDVTYPDTVDFISTVDTPYTAELNIWYHTLNVGFRTRIGGETDFPCIYDGRVGIGRSYVKVDEKLTFEGWLKGFRQGRSYTSDGKGHLMDFKANDLEVGKHGSELQLNAPQTVHVSVRVAANLDPMPNESIRRLSPNEKPYWDLERARVGDTREVPVEVVENGAVVARKNVVADGQVRDLSFEVPVKESSWIALRILPSAHTNPIFVVVGGKPIRASRRSAEWCLAAVDQCWTQKAPAISTSERVAAQKAYEHARETYRRLINESQER